MLIRRRHEALLINSVDNIPGVPSFSDSLNSNENFDLGDA
jgi:hypothetical protein